jgi:hypothetical protein
MKFNQALVKKQGLTSEDTDLLKEIYKTMFALFDHMSSLDPTKDIDELQKCVISLELTEFYLQRTWKFSEDRNFHTWWYKAPHCSCGLLDNQDRVGTSYRVIDGGCPLHGDT